MRIAMIAAMANQRVIGKNNKMPWHLPEDLRHFKAMTMAKPVLMGRKTFDSIGKPLPGRHNIVISRQAGYQPQDVTVVNSVENAILAAGECEELVIIGGGDLYKQMLPRADILYITEINLDVAGDTYFPDWNDGSWQIENSVTSINDKGLQYTFNTLIKLC